MLRLSRQFLLVLTFVFCGPAFAELSKEETSALQDFIQVYKESKTFHQLARRTHFHGGFTVDRAIEIMGPAYTSELPKLSYDLEKGTLSFNVKEGAKFKKIDLKFASMKSGEILANGRTFKINPNLSGLENAVLLGRALNSKSKASILDVIMSPAFAQEKVGELKYREYESGDISKLRAWTVLGMLDSSGEALYSGAAAGALVGKGLAIGASFGATTAAILALPGHYVVKKIHAYASPKCAEQAADIAAELVAMKKVMIGLSCENFFGDPKLIFASEGGRNQTLHANWERGDAYFGQHGPLYVFDRNSLREVREIGDEKEYYDRSAGKKDGFTANILSFKTGPKFDEHKAAIEPYRKILNIMGKYESCYKCEKEFQDVLVKRVTDTYESNGREISFKDALEDYRRWMKVSKDGRPSNGNEVER